MTISSAGGHHENSSVYSEKGRELQSQFRYPSFEHIKYPRVYIDNQQKLFNTGDTEMKAFTFVACILGKKIESTLHPEEHKDTCGKSNIYVF